MSIINRKNYKIGICCLFVSVFVFGFILIKNPLVFDVESSGDECIPETISASVIGTDKVNLTAMCEGVFVDVINPTTIRARFLARADEPNPLLCRQTYDIWYTEGTGWQIQKCYKIGEPCWTELLMESYVGTFNTGPMEDTDEGTGDGQPDFSATIEATIVPPTGCCGNGLPNYGEVCDDPAGNTATGYGVAFPGDQVCHTTCQYIPTASQSIDCDIDVSSPGVEGFYRWTIGIPDNIWPVPSNSSSTNNTTLAVCGNKTTSGSVVKALYDSNFWGTRHWEGGNTACWNIARLDIPINSNSVSFLWDDSVIINGKNFTDLKNQMQIWHDAGIISNFNLPFAPNLVINNVMGWPINVNKEVHPGICVSCGNGVVDSGEECDNNSNFNWTDVGYVTSLDSKPYCHTTAHANACQIHYPAHCGDGITQHIHGEQCDGGLGCSSDCKLNNSAWFRTVGGDVYYSGGVNQTPSTLVHPFKRIFSSYMCYNRSGQFIVGAGCYNNIFDVNGRPTNPNFVMRVNNESVENSANIDYSRLVQKLNGYTNGNTYTSDGISVKFYNTTAGLPTEISDNRIVYLTGDLIINNDIRYASSCPNQRSCSLLLVVEGNVTISKDVLHLDAFIVAGNKIIVEK